MVKAMKTRKDYELVTDKKRLNTKWFPGLDPEQNKKGHWYKNW